MPSGGRHCLERAWQTTQPALLHTQMRHLLGHVAVASEHLTMLMLQHAYLAAPQQLTRQSPANTAAERGERLMSAVIVLGGQPWAPCFLFLVC